MRILALFVFAIFLFEEIEPQPRSVIRRINSSVKPTLWHNKSDSDDSDDSDSDSDSDDEDSGCPTINNKIRSNASVNCINGKLYINGKVVENAKRTDRIDIISNQLRINGKLIRRISPTGNINSNNSINNSGSSNKVSNVTRKNVSTSNNVSNVTRKNTSTSNTVSNVTKKNIATSDECPSVVQIGCTNVFTSCVNGQFYINGEFIKNVKSTDTVEIIANNLKINGEPIRYIPPSGSKKPSMTDKIGNEERKNGDENKKINIVKKDDKKVDDDNGKNNGHQQIRPNINMNFCNDVFYKIRDGKLFVNDFEVKNYKPTDKVLIDHNNLYVNGNFISYIEPKESNGWAWG